MIQLPHAKENDTLAAFMSRVVSQRAWSTISVAVAYASVSGVRQFYDLVRRKHPSANFRWLLGLDDFITQPGAIAFCDAVPHSELRIFSAASGRSRFHPKLYFFEDGRASSLIVGSANLTAAALGSNCEAVAIVGATGVRGITHIRTSFESVWALGKKPSSRILTEYAAGYEKYRRSRAFIIGGEPLKAHSVKPGDVLRSDEAQIDPSIADVCWIEVGKNTALGRELEFKAEQALFFGLTPTGGSSEMRKFRVSNGAVVPLRLKYQQNAMWRLQMTRDIPEVATGLRPLIRGKLQRSPFVAVFVRGKSDSIFRLTFIRSDSKAFSQIRADSMKLGTMGTTSARKYGWY